MHSLENKLNSVAAVTFLDNRADYSVFLGISNSFTKNDTLVSQHAPISSCSYYKSWFRIKINSN